MCHRGVVEDVEHFLLHCTGLVDRGENGDREKKIALNPWIGSKILDVLVDYI